MDDVKYPIGIDLGTTNSVLAVHRNYETEILEVQDLKIVPSFVYYDPTNDEVSIGDFSKSHICGDNGIYDAKRFIGRSIDDELVQQLKNTYSFKIEEDPTNGIQIPIKKNDKTIYKSIPEISSEILKLFKETASEYLNYEVSEAVITVPAYFNFSQRNATKQAAEIAGLNVLMLLNEPTAAALSYITERLKNNVKCLIFDFGGGTFDVSIVELSNDNITALGVDGDTFLGGRNIDENIFNYIIKKYELNGLNKVQNRRLMTKIENIKKKLSFKPNFKVIIEYFFSDKEFPFTLSRTELEDINKELFEKCLAITNRCINNLSIERKDIDKIILVGGSTKIPKIREMIKEKFVGKDILVDVNPDEAIAAGAAIQAAGIKGLTKGIIKVTDVTPFTLGIEVFGGKMSPLIKKNTSIPTEYSKSYLIRNNTQNNMTITIYEGERSRCKLNNLLGKFTIKNLPLKPEIKVFVKFVIDSSGLLKVTAQEESGESSALEIAVELHNLKTTKAASVDEVQDKIFNKFVDTKTKARRLCLDYIKSYGNDNVNSQKCKSFIDDILKLEFENRENLNDIIQVLLKDITDNDLSKSISSLTIE